ncbi:hypothetical protein QFZ75_002823 [Streptomyces sp. V3I8]|uniref:hypothetical protein n=1 Tax=Streptomyces sp. V3I8 TaxID=3042279 RepID=UPI00277F1755|nr:hypothetical protein [Streptomyces sp. V3I8]MDQ1036407.1 hypothetical protein [Streptomyces sp. V3I8]
MLVTDASDDLYIALVLLLSAAGIVVTPWLVTRAVRLLRRDGGGRDAQTVVKGVAALTGACAVGLYGWGVLHLLMLDESGQALACEKRLRSEQVESVVGYEYSFLPLHFRCRVTGGRTYDAVVPGYVNPVAGAFGAAALALTWAARPTYWYEETKGRL